jgi:hypothetical protein
MFSYGLHWAEYIAAGRFQFWESLTSTSRNESEKNKCQPYR